MFTLKLGVTRQAPGASIQVSSGGREKCVFYLKKRFWAKIWTWCSSSGTSKGTQQAWLRLDEFGGCTIWDVTLLAIQ